MNKKRVEVGVGVFIFKDREFLMIQRQGAHGAGSWSLPGGHLEYGESFDDTAIREVKEETNLNIKDIRFGAVTNDYFKNDNKHYITVWMLSDWESGVEMITEPDKCLRQEWHTFNDLPSDLFLPWKQLLSSDFIINIKNTIENNAR